jgi:hypothetical protein
MRTALKISASVYRMLLFLYPEDLQEHFADEMVDVFEQQLCGELEQSGIAGVVCTWSRAFWELFWVALPVQLCEPVVVAPTFSLLISSVSFTVLLATLGPHPVVHILIAQGR